MVDTTPEMPCSIAPLLGAALRYALLERLPEHSSYFLSMHDLTLQFEHWCGQNGHQPWTTRNFKKALKEREFEEGRKPNVRGFINLKFK